MWNFEVHILKNIEVTYLRSGKENEDPQKEHGRTLKESNIDLHMLEVLQLSPSCIPELLHPPGV